ncbi:NUDIX hydrolase [Microvirga thermotolerans]|uniref:NUDIX domain-containing protein n=1 Tax=Microvirga thermotolerans TaxID=2651334 RepID=A0A5P9JT82_9HYPH|nr:NUDIX domain-containing protein [Microvirga thermotolerans]QFU14988.1 NUDIX domain-containing protein [Microvirga thermotolerans]
MPVAGANAPIRIVAAVIRDAAGRILLVRKQGTQAFMQPGGKREPGEDDAAALARELREELGCAVRPGSLRYLETLTAPAANEAGRLVEAALYAAAVEGRPAVSAEIAEMRWIDPSAPPDIVLAPLTREGVLPLLRRETADR